MVGKTILAWMDEHERHPGYLARKAGLSAGALIALIVGEDAAIPAELKALEEAMALAPGQLVEAASENAGGVGAKKDPLTCLTVKEVAARMQVSEDTVRKEMELGMLHCITVGQRVKRIPWAALQQRLDRWEIGA